MMPSPSLLTRYASYETESQGPRCYPLMGFEAWNSVVTPSSPEGDLISGEVSSAFVLTCVEE